MNNVSNNKKSFIRAFGSYLPSNVVSNFDLAKTIDTNDEWIVTRTGIKQRHIRNAEETTAMMATNAAKKLLNNAKMDVSKIDGIIVATTTPDQIFPSVAVAVQNHLQIKKAFAFDIQAVCAGFIYAISVANSLIISGLAKNILVIGADAMSKIVDWQDRSTSVLFGDGAGAVLLALSDQHESESDRGIICTKICSDGEYKDILYANSVTPDDKSNGFVRMQGKDVFKHAVEKMSGVMMDVLSGAGYSIDEVKYVVPHQANARIIEAIAVKLKIPLDKVIMTVDKHANTSAASIPLALDDAFSQGKLKVGDLVLTTAIGGGLAWGACLFRV